MTMTSEQVRQCFLDYFQSHGHTVVAGSSLVPGNDPTLLFTNAGMVQFKDIFLGLEKRPYSQAASSQRCVRAGGKHNDLENVGYTARHHTFFEMLGNFSFGDYFKEKAIDYAWDFLINTLKIPPEKLWITVYEEDDEAYKIWAQKTRVEKSHLLRCGAQDNFWSMGETGPCGPCTEIYYDHGETVRGGLPGTPEADGDRYVEIWNLVFMQYERQIDGTLIPLPKPSVDTGMGLERICAVLQGVHNNYETDLFKPIIDFAVQKLYLQTHPHAQTADLDDNKTRFNVFADHIRSSAFLIMDGVIPSNEGRGYVLRRIIRRAIRQGYQCQMPSLFFHQLVSPLAEVMSNAYPQLKKSQEFIEKVLRQEEEQFAYTLDQGMKILTQTLQTLDSNIIPGEIIFRLYDTYGFPVDLTADIAREKNLLMDEAGFQLEMEKQRKLSQDNQKFSSAALSQIAQHLKVHKNTIFTGYDNVEASRTHITAVIKNTQNHIEGLVLASTPFYAESGGQVGDQGIIQSPDAIFQVTDTRKAGQHIVHYGYIKQGDFKENENVVAIVDTHRRQQIASNHSATHLLHAALRQLLGEHVQQKGSLVAPDRLRFDFSHPSALSTQEILALEKLVNQKIRENLAGEVTETTPDEAIKSGAMALFGEKYGETIRTLKLGDFSYEVCGGTHVARTGDIGIFKIISETGIAAGIRRIEAVTGEGAEQWLLHTDTLLKAALDILKANRETVVPKLHQLLESQKQLQKQLSQLQNKSAAELGHQLVLKAHEINHIKVIAEKLENSDSKILRELVDHLKQKLGKAAIIILCGVYEHKVNLVIGVTSDLVNQFPANQLVAEAAPLIGGKGGGRPDMAQAGGDKPEYLEKALSAVLHFIQEKS
jgi:alanyl-tRNA synthetase